MIGQRLWDTLFSKCQTYSICTTIVVQFVFHANYLSCSNDRTVILGKPVYQWTWWSFLERDNRHGCWQQLPPHSQHQQSLDWPWKIKWWLKSVGMKRSSQKKVLDICTLQMFKCFTFSGFDLVQNVFNLFVMSIC